MATFNAETAGVEPMVYDFTAWGVDAKGTIPEPSNQMMETFQRRSAETMQKASLVESAMGDNPTEEQVARALEEARKLSESMDKNIAKLCQNQPSAEQCAALPFRIKQAFNEWLMAQFRPAGN